MLIVVISKMKGENVMKQDSKRMYINLVFRLLFVSVYTYWSLIYYSPDYEFDIMKALLFLIFGYLVMFVGFHIIDYLTLKRITLSIRRTFLISVYCSMIFLIIRDGYLISETIRHQLQAMIFAFGYVFLPSIISYGIYFLFRE